MLPILTIEDGFFQDPVAVRESLLAGDFGKIVSPIDAVTYTGINLDVPQEIVDEFVHGIWERFGGKIVVRSIFARIMRGGEKAPNKVHSDKIMGDYSAHAYLSLDWPDGAGTSFWTHDLEGAIHTDSTDLSNIDTSNLDRWSRYLLVQAKFNRIVIHNAKYWHCAEPVDGWGDEPSNARLVLTCFFEAHDDDEEIEGSPA